MSIGAAMNYRKSPVEHKFQLALAFTFGMIVALTIINVANYYAKTPVQKDIYQMKRLCEASHQVLDGNLEAACGEMIDKVEAQGFEVLNKDGHFWAESREQ